MCNSSKARPYSAGNDRPGVAQVCSVLGFPRDSAKCYLHTIYGCVSYSFVAFLYCSVHEKYTVELPVEGIALRVCRECQHYYYAAAAVTTKEGSQQIVSRPWQQRIPTQPLM